MANILKDVIQHGTGRAALKIGRDDLGGKTGTTNDAKDAWFAGFNGKLVTVAWVGFDQPTTLGRREYGGVAALPIWTNFMGNALKGTPSSWVHLDKDAKAPTLHDETQFIQGETKKDYRASPPLAQPLYRPKPAAPVRAPERDFEDLPDDDQTLQPSHQTPPSMQPNPAAKKPDALEHLIDQVQ
jgi:penicillin-binding protein 1A